MKRIVGPNVNPQATKVFCAIGY